MHTTAGLSTTSLMTLVLGFMALCFETDNLFYDTGFWFRIQGDEHLLDDTCSTTSRIHRSLARVNNGNDVVLCHVVANLSECITEPISRELLASTDAKQSRETR